MPFHLFLRRSFLVWCNPLVITVLIACTSDVLSIKLIAKTSVTNSTLCFLLGLKRLQVLHLNLPSIFEFIFVHDVKRGPISFLPVDIRLSQHCVNPRVFSTAETQAHSFLFTTYVPSWCSHFPWEGTLLWMQLRCCLSVSILFFWKCFYFAFILGGNL